MHFQAEPESFPVLFQAFPAAFQAFVRRPEPYPMRPPPPPPVILAASLTRFPAWKPFLTRSFVAADSRITLPSACRRQQYRRRAESVSELVRDFAKLFRIRSRNSATTAFAPSPRSAAFSISTSTRLPASLILQLGDLPVLILELLVHFIQTFRQLVGRRSDNLRRFTQHPAVVFDDIEGVHARRRFDSAHACSNPCFRQDLEESDLCRVRDVTSSTAPRRNRRPEPPGRYRRTFSPNSAIAPSFLASSIFIVEVLTFIAFRICVLTIFSTSRIWSWFTGSKWLKSKRRRVGETKEPACSTWSPENHLERLLKKMRRGMIPLCRMSEPAVTCDSTTRLC